MLFRLLFYYGPGNHQIYKPGYIKASMHACSTMLSQQQPTLSLESGLDLKQNIATQALESTAV